MDAYQSFDSWITAIFGERKTNDDLSPRILSTSPIQSTNTTGTYLEHLNEDCLLQIFSSNSLTQMDLCSLAETCTRFQQVTQRVFPRNYSIAKGYREYQVRWKSGWQFYEKLEDVQRILKNFGSHLTELEISRTDQDLVKLVGMHCSDVTLNHLGMSGLPSIDGVKTHMNSIFQRLLQLYVSKCHFLNGVTSLGLNCVSLIELKIRSSRGCVLILKQTFPNLERFSWILSHVYTEGSSNARHLFDFIRRHGHLKTLYLADESVCRSQLLHVIDNTCKKLEYLKLDCMSSQLSFASFTQGGLAKLKTLILKQVNAKYNENIGLLQAVKLSLETIKLCSWKNKPFDGLDVLLEMQNLRELHLEDCPIDCIPWTRLTRLKKVYLVGLDEACNSAHLLNVIRQLINLEELKYAHSDSGDTTYDSFCDLSKEDLAEIIKIVERREHVLTLKCYFWINLDEYCNENQQVKFVKLKRFCDSDEE